MHRFGGQGVVEDGPLKGRRFIIPAIVYVEKGQGLNGGSEYSKACLVHHKFIPESGCDQCIDEIKAEQDEARRIGLS